MCLRTILNNNKTILIRDAHDLSHLRTLAVEMDWQNTTCFCCDKRFNLRSINQKIVVAYVGKLRDRTCRDDRGNSWDSCVRHSDNFVVAADS